MRRLILFTGLILAASMLQAATLEELETAKQAAAQRAKEAAGIDLSGGSDGSVGTGPAAGQDNGCIGSAPGGQMSLLGVQSEYKGGPSTQGLSPVTKLGPQHPAMTKLIELGWEMGLYADPEEPKPSPEVVARNAAARERKGLHDTYADFVSYGTNGTMKGGLPMAELFGWVYEGKMEQMAKAYAEYEELLRRYAPLYQAAEAAGRACP